MELLALITQGQDNRQISESLGLGEGTVRADVSALLAKLGRGVKPGRGLRPDVVSARATVSDAEPYSLRRILLDIPQEGPGIVGSNSRTPRAGTRRPVLTYFRRKHRVCTAYYSPESAAPHVINSHEYQP